MRVSAFLVIFIGCYTQLTACTGIVMQSEDHASVSGRTVEFGIELDMNLAVIPRNFSFKGKTPKGEGLAYTSKYAAVGMYCFEDPVLMDGMNEKGLVAAAFYFPGYADYVEVTSDNQKKALSPADLPNWILTQFATLDEVKEGLKSVIVAPTVLQGWGASAPPMHYIVYDKSGNSIVIEPLNQSFKIHDNPLGVITNSPTFDWHLTNLNNYINLSPVNADSKKLRTLSLHPFGQGTGMLGLPGDFTPPSRFVRAAFFSASALPVKTSKEAVDQTFHILNQFDIPLGAIRQQEGNQTAYDYTLITTVKNHETLAYFYRSYANATIQYASLNDFDLNASTIKSLKVHGIGEKQNVSSLVH